MKNFKHSALCAFKLILAFSAMLLPFKPTSVFAEDQLGLLPPDCKDGYEYVEAVSKCYKKCQDGWERNPETNRCRKVRVEDAPKTVPAETPPADTSPHNTQAPSDQAALSPSATIKLDPTPSASTCKDGYEYVASADKCYKKCQDGWERNPETNHCRKTPVESEYETGAAKSLSSSAKSVATKTSKSASETGPTSCKEGYEYVESAGKCYKKCQDGQVRNPETNRCKKATTGDSEQKECQEGYERNPDTNRCRKIKNNTGAEHGIDVPNTGGSPPAFVAGGIIVALLAAGIIFVAFQYRLEIKEFVKKHFKKSEKSS